MHPSEAGTSSHDGFEMGILFCKGGPNVEQTPVSFVSVFTSSFFTGLKTDFIGLADFGKTQRSLMLFSLF